MRDEFIIQTATGATIEATSTQEDDGETLYWISAQHRDVGSPRAQLTRAELTDLIEQLTAVLDAGAPRAAGAALGANRGARRQ